MEYTSSQLIYVVKITLIPSSSAIGTKRFDSELSGDREVQRTMLELLNQLDGFSATAGVKVIAGKREGCACVVYSL